MIKLDTERGEVQTGIVLIMVLMFFIVFIVLFSTIRFVVEVNEVQSTMDSIANSLALDIHYRKYGDKTNGFTKRFMNDELDFLDRKIYLDSVQIVLVNDLTNVAGRKLKELKNKNLSIAIQSYTGIGGGVNDETVGSLSTSEFSSVYKGTKGIKTFVDQYGGNAINISRDGYPENYRKDGMIIIAYKLRPGIYPKLIVGGDRESDFDIDKESVEDDMPYSFSMSRYKLPYERNQ